MTETSSTQTPDTDPVTTSSTDPRAVVVPDRPALEGLEDKWSRVWADNDTYAFDRTQPRANVYSIDTPRRRSVDRSTSATSTPTATPT